MRGVKKKQTNQYQPESANHKPSNEQGGFKLTTMHAAQMLV
jgi:hypothetical protein